MIMGRQMKPTTLSNTMIIISPTSLTHLVENAATNMIEPTIRSPKAVLVLSLTVLVLLANFIL